MSAHTILLDFTVDPVKIKDETQITTLTTNIENILRNYVKNLKEVCRLNLNEGTLKMYTCDSEAVVNLRFYNNGLITLNVEYYKNEENDLLFPFEVKFLLI